MDKAQMNKVIESTKLSMSQATPDVLVVPKQTLLSMVANNMNGVKNITHRRLPYNFALK